ncbi:unnamed protein product [Rotaria sp. Silwood1]|nr:unnamed protein product [Rotaria sp. Silwood1]CAF1577847.1 unnamed protein product [Rotaria sp. Silwood1]CAF3624920.1 unnamed protein product [Rotaria sp. Silwood1]CAF3629782.1 unnamed protein product [Rotaria sp. Silwood1]CAF3657070.1 unnamed protein product [Rotaria sp. Silwood1]
MVNMSSSNNSTPRSTNHTESKSHHHQCSLSNATTVSVTHSTIDDFREIIREQSFIIPNNSSSDHNHIDVPVKKYPPLPDIAVPNSSSTNNTFFRTETVLTTPKQNQPKKQMFYHFAPTQRGHLPALNKRHILPIMSNVMDLDEDLPQCNTTIAHRAATYTSPSDRSISPIKRPSAPSPPASAQIKRPGHNAFVYGQEDQDEEDEENCSILDDEDSQYFNDHFSRYNNQSITMTNHRIDHYNNTDRYINMNDRQNTIIIDSGHDEPTHPLDSIEFEP